MPLSLRRKGSITSLFSGKGHRRSPSELSISAIKPEVTPNTAAKRSSAVPLALTPLNDVGHSKARPPPSAFRGVRPAPPSPNPKGKERAMATPAAPIQSRPGRAHWVVDSFETHRGTQIWSQQSRVILVVGEPSRAALAPLLYSPVFADTLVLVGSLEPIPEIELLNSPSHLLHSDPIYPTVQPFQPPSSAVAEATHPVTVVLQYGAALAEAHRRDMGQTSAAGPRSRRGSSTSLSGSQTPPGTPRSRRRMWSFGSNTPAEAATPSVSRHGSALDLSRIVPESTRSGTPPIAGDKERKGSHKRTPSLFKKEQVVSDGSPIDAVINFIPFADPRLEQQRVLQAMLQNTVVLTTAALPILATAVTTSSFTAQIPITELSPLSLIHIVPVDAPLQLPTVIERFLLPLLPTMACRVRRPLFGCVTGYGAWLTPTTDPGNDGSSGAETLLFGGVRCPGQIAEAEGVKPQAMLAGWDHCVASPGLLTEAVESMKTPPTFSRQASHLALSELRTQPTRTSAPSSSQSMMSVVSPATSSPPSSPSIASSGSLPPRPAAARSPSPTAALQATTPSKQESKGAVSPPQEPRQIQAKTPSPPLKAREPVTWRDTPTMRTRRSTTRPTSDEVRSKTPTPDEYIRPESVTPRATSTLTSSERPFTSRFDPRYAELEARHKAEAEATMKAQAKAALRATLTSSSSSRSTPPLPDGAAPPAEFVGHDRRARGPSGLRNAVTVPPNNLQSSPPTPELDPSSSSCSSSSVLEPSFSEERSGSSARSSKRSSSTPAHMSVSKPISGSISRRGLSGLTGFTSIFKRRSVKA
ncbi:hypothetical protein CcaverHIS002_0504570 [Cutaneotrichosporon cavernicola]|uniref:Uncharacterized protein n=1 Tax=Cutaneotrichosporon cavernicola TaxID=279322 RepID=A0AA48L6H4_9TREE|nr:uncharacterized protein CcaverHIS019_0505120 [Cutaneotrichosporon cavernicola]BEI85056.1 hypothetical protein CcaverHIS002_0504570 [Cutaneotrichosporon cavernicola]BEI92884.1 hypothetical protein CcaverHIS019_0505120 [Cutaneotrichosporon cavernicola]BEJ00660.1 hypothetical protein CcaverHIS631_0505170 [Cutaneotrichosporon cavernicola]